MPPLTPVTTPVVEPMVAIPVLLLLQAPPEVASVSVVLAPEHTDGVPDIDDGAELTVTDVVTKQLAPIE